MATTLEPKFIKTTEMSTPKTVEELKSAYLGAGWRLLHETEGAVAFSKPTRYIEDIENLDEEEERNEVGARKGNLLTLFIAVCLNGVRHHMSHA